MLELEFTFADWVALECRSIYIERDRCCKFVLGNTCKNVFEAIVFPSLFVPSKGCTNFEEGNCFTTFLQVIGMCLIDGHKVISFTSTRWLLIRHFWENIK